MADNLELEKNLWQAVDKFCNKRDVAGKYIDFATIAEDGIAFDKKIGSFPCLLKNQMQRANELGKAINVKPC